MIVSSSKVSGQPGPADHELARVRPCLRSPWSAQRRNHDGVLAVCQSRQPEEDERREEDDGGEHAPLRTRIDPA